MSICDSTRVCVGQQARRLDAAAEAPRWLLAEVLWRSGREEEAAQELEEIAQLLFETRDEIERGRARMSGILRKDDVEEILAGLPKRRREAINNRRRRFASAGRLVA